MNFLVFTDKHGNPKTRPEIVGNATEGALIQLGMLWGYEYERVHKQLFDASRDKVFAFNSKKKRSTTILHRQDGSVRLFCKGAPECVLMDSTHYTKQDGTFAPMTVAKRDQIDAHLKTMAGKTLRTLCLAHRDFTSAAELPSNWMHEPPDHSDLVVDCIVGIIDPLRDDVKDAVHAAQRAGITVRMITGDSILTASAIARECGILTDEGIALEGPVFRNMTPKQLDQMLPRLQVLARSSPDDKYLLVTRLNGRNIPANKEEWEAKHPGFSWENDRDSLLPGYKEEWERSRPDGGQVVGVTGDGTNDAPALRAADVGLSMGATGTRVAKDASDIVILDDKFSSIVKSIKWGRSVYDNIRKFLQFQLTVNIVALLLVFIGTCTGKGSPLQAVMMLWVNLIMDTMGALALGTEKPSDELLHRMPYKRNASLISWPMWRNILFQVACQLIVLLLLLFWGYSWFGVKEGSVKHYTIIFNTFVFYQIFNEFNSRSIFSEVNVWKGLGESPMFMAIIVFTAIMQFIIVQYAGAFAKTLPLSLIEWAITVQEDPESFVSNKQLWDSFGATAFSPFNVSNGRLPVKNNVSENDGIIQDL